MSDPVIARRRWFGVFFLTVAAALLTWGQTVFKPYLDGFGFVFYWSVCLLFVLLAIWMAVIDAREVRRQMRAEKVELFKRTFDELAADEEALRRQRAKSAPKN
jgi:DNA-binding transcriptional regulator of glucitol operon